jgi:hypothetical protein
MYQSAFTIQIYYPQSVYNIYQEKLYSENYCMLSHGIASSKKRPASQDDSTLCSSITKRTYQTSTSNPKSNRRVAEEDKDPGVWNILAFRDHLTPSEYAYAIDKAERAFNPNGKVRVYSGEKTLMCPFKDCKPGSIRRSDFKKHYDEYHRDKIGIECKFTLTIHRENEKYLGNYCGGEKAVDKRAEELLRECANSHKKDVVES